ncbi:hypothetical protein V7S43_017208 [Phytophthora oleae]|uniref:Uncharacterized protein n=1 Tax=Phytophthora oleae TaxID=2107226 RepID=A0ABD3EXY3_9STRA
METTEEKNSAPVSMSVPWFVPLTAPKIESTSHAALIKWRRAHREYEQQVAMRLHNDPDKLAEAVTSIKDSFSLCLLDVLCNLKRGIRKEDVTNELLLAKIDGIIATVVNNSVPNVAEEFKLAVKMNLKESDVRERVVQFFRAGRELIEERGWGEFFTDGEGKKLKCKMIVSAIDPPALREDVEATLAYQLRSARTDERALFQLVLEKSLEHERDFQRRKGQRKAARPEETGRDASARPKKKSRFGSSNTEPKVSFRGKRKAGT